MKGLAGVFGAVGVTTPTYLYLAIAQKVTKAEMIFNMGRY